MSIQREEFDRQVELHRRNTETAKQEKKRKIEQSKIEHLIASLDAVAFKARPFKMSSGFQISKSNAPPTRPMSPDFATDKRFTRPAC